MAQNSVKWTDKQLAAINERDKTLLVSAAAGSGKTAVLTKRIINRLCDTENPADISRTLIVTFTKAAANELKTRISKALSEAIAENPQNMHLRKQLLLLTSAKICTIHSFCLDVIRRNYKELSIPGNFGIANENELNLLAESIMSDVVNDAYSGKLSDNFVISDFLSLSSLFSKTGMDTSLETNLLSLYTKLESYPEGVEFIKNACQSVESELELPFYLTQYGKKIVTSIAGSAKHLYNKYTQLEKSLQCDEEAYTKYIPLLSDEKSFLDSFSDCVYQNKFDTSKNIFDAFEMQRLPSLKRGYQSEFTQPLKDLREALKKSVLSALNDVFNQDEIARAFEGEQSCKLIKCLYSILKEFENRFIAEKKNSGRLSYADLERFTFSLLINDGKPTDAAREIAGSFDEIYIDEYQDTNTLQDMIFSSISSPTNRFMVGDIKQSIYGFRGAAPENFAKYRDSFPVLSDENRDSATENTIFLSDNFRCDKSVVDFCNSVFSCIFRNATGRISYYDSDNLGFSKIDGDKNTYPVKVILAEKDSELKSPENLTEAEYIANEIKRLITSEKKSDATPIKPSDIAILFRNKAASIEIEAALNKLYIPSSNSIETEFFENPEILLVMALLNTIDNPLRDIHLAGTLKSPLFNFTLDELVLIRAYSKKASLYEALVDYTDENEFSKGKYFLEKLNYFRKIAEGSQVDRLIKLLYRKLSLFSIVSQNKAQGLTPEAARENLMLLYSYARDFESSSFKGLSSFIEFVNDIISNNKKIAAASSSNTADAVQLMTIHHSKGLEFPVVFIAAAEKTPSSMDLRPNVLIEKHTGISIDLPGLLPGTKIKTMYRKAMEIAINENVFEEEMRVLYVALTRARERLYITASYKDPQSEYEKCEKLSREISPEIIMARRSFMELVLIPILANTVNDDTKYEVIFPTVNDINDFDSDEIFESEFLSDEAQDEMIGKIKENLNFEYPYLLPVNIPSKLSVSKLKANVLDDFDTPEYDDIASIKPKFMSEETDSASAADKGSATHTFMQFANFENVEKVGVSAEINRLLDLSYFDKGTAELIDSDSVRKFFESTFYNKTIKTADKLWREHRFNVEMPAHYFTSDNYTKEKIKDEKIFVQGIIDLFIKNSDGTYTLIDYKTDHIPREYYKRDNEFELLLAKRHSEQLSYYKYALERITKAKVSRVLIYSFALNREVDITDKCNIIFG